MSCETLKNLGLIGAEIINQRPDPFFPQNEDGREVVRQVEYFNLDVIISVGYRVNFKRGTQFRIWTTTTLKEHLIRGYTINRERFERNARELETALKLVQKAAVSGELAGDMGRGLVEIISCYIQTFLLLQHFDEGLLDPACAGMRI